jgi:hypothetical protein
MKRCLPINISLLLFLLFLGLQQVNAQTFDYGKTYTNVSKGVNGGTVETGDTLEIRTTFVVRTSYYDSCAYYDTLRAGTAYIPGTLKILTNEGKTYKALTDALLDVARNKLYFGSSSESRRLFWRSFLLCFRPVSLAGAIGTFLPRSLRKRLWSLIGPLIDRRPKQQTMEEAAVSREVLSPLGKS